MKILHVSSFPGEYKEGNWSGEKTKSEGEIYLKIDGQFIHKAYVFIDCPENRLLLDNYNKEYAAWKKREPNLYTMLNLTQKP